MHIVLLVVWTLEVCAVTAGSLVPASTIAFAHLPNDKLLHFGGYFVAAVLTPFAFASKRRAALVAVGLVALGAGLELAQKLAPGRSCDLRDAVANAAGVACGFVLAMVLRVAFFALWRRVRTANDPL